MPRHSSRFEKYAASKKVSSYPPLAVAPGLYGRISTRDSETVEYLYYALKTLPSEMDKNRGCKISIMSLTRNDHAIEYHNATGGDIASQKKGSCTETIVANTGVKEQFEYYHDKKTRLAIEIISNLFPCNKCRHNDYTQKFLGPWGIDAFLKTGYPHLVQAESGSSSESGAYAHSQGTPGSSSRSSSRSRLSSGSSREASPASYTSPNAKLTDPSPAITSHHNYCWLLTTREDHPCSPTDAWYATCIRNLHPTSYQSGFIKDDPGLFNCNYNQVNGKIKITFDDDDVKDFVPLFIAENKQGTQTIKALDQLSDEHVRQFLRTYQPGPSGPSGGHGSRGTPSNRRVATRLYAGSATASPTAAIPHSATTPPVVRPSSMSPGISAPRIRANPIPHQPHVPQDENPTPISPPISCVSPAAYSQSSSGAPKKRAHAETSPEPDTKRARPNASTPSAPTASASSARRRGQAQESTASARSRRNKSSSRSTSSSHTDRARPSTSISIRVEPRTRFSARIASVLRHRMTDLSPDTASRAARHAQTGVQVGLLTRHSLLTQNQPPRHTAPSRSTSSRTRPSAKSTVRRSSR